MYVFLSFSLDFKYDGGASVIIEVCVGSSCHVKGSYDVVREIQRFFEEKGISGLVEIRGSFCMGNCTEGVSIKINNSVFSASKENVALILEEKWQESQNEHY